MSGELGEVKVKRVWKEDSKTFIVISASELPKLMATQKGKKGK